MRQFHCFSCILGPLLALSFSPLLTRAAGPPQKGPISFINDVAPILKQNCFACHDAKKRKGKLDMTTFAGLRKGGNMDDPVTPGKPEESLLIDLITQKDDGRMPPREAGDPLPREQVAVIAQWIKEGAKLDADLKPEADLWRALRLRWQPPLPPATYKFPVNVNSLAFTPDNQKLVIGGYHELTVWETNPAKLVKRIYTRAERTYALVFLADGKLAVAGGRPGQEGDVRIYDMNGGMPTTVNGVTVLDGVHDKGVMLQQLLETDDSVLCLAVSSDGKHLAAGGCDRLVRVWDLTTGPAQARLEHTIENHADWVFGLVFTPDGGKLLTASRDKTAKMWDLKTKESVLTFPGHLNSVYAVGVQPGGMAGFSAGEDNQLRMWATTGEGKQLRVLGSHGKPIFKIAQHNDPRNPILATCGADGTVQLWHPQTGQHLRTLTGHTDWVYALAISPNGKQVASGSWNGEVRVWNTADGKLVQAFNASPGYVAPK